MTKFHEFIHQDLDRVHDVLHFVVSGLESIPPTENVHGLGDPLSSPQIRLSILGRWPSTRRLHPSYLDGAR